MILIYLISNVTNNILITAVGVDEFGVCESNPEVVQDGRFMEVTESREVVLTHQDVRVTKRRQNSTLWVQLVLKFL